MEQMTVTQTLELTVRNLQSIRVPVGLINDISIPIAQAITNLVGCIQTFKAQENPEQFPEGEEMPEEEIHVEDHAE